MMKYIATILTVLLLLCSSLSAQQKSVHQQALEAHKNVATHPTLLGDQSQKPIKLQERQTKLNKTVFGFLPYWASSDYLQYDKLTHIAAFSIEIHKTGNILNDHNWPWTSLINTAHSAGVKVILTATLFNGNDIHTLITNSTYKNTFFTNMRALMLEGNADGLNVDFESLNSADRGININTFMAELTAYLHAEIPGCEVSFDGPAVNWGGWDFAGLANSCDYIFIMGYSFSGSWSATSAPTAPLIGGSYNITNTIDNQYGLVTQTMPEKLILGVPYYGQHWRTQTGSAYSTALESIGSVFYSSAANGASTYGRLWDSASKTPWYRYQNGNDWHQVWYDDAQSLGLKYDLALSRNLDGAGIWALGYDGDRPELWNLIDEKFGSGTLPAPARPEALRVLYESDTALRIKFRASANATGYYAYLSGNGLAFADSVFLASNDELLTGLQSDSLYYIRVRASNSSGMSLPTEVLAGVPSAEAHSVLIVNGFDRISGTANTRNFVRQHGSALKNKGLAFSSASNEAIFFDLLSLRGFKSVDWILGDESTADDTFNPIEQDSVKAYLRDGGNLFVSGAEIGWDLVDRGSSSDQNFYANFLKAQYISDAPNNQNATYYTAEPVSGSLFDAMPAFNFDDGTHGTFDVDWPDAIKAKNGSGNALKFQGVSTSAGLAGVYFEGFFPGSATIGKLVHLSVPFETVYPVSARNEIMSRIIDFFDTPSSFEPGRDLKPEAFVLHQNFPNPFNPSTTIAFTLPENGRVSLDIFDVLGRKVAGFETEEFSPGYHQWLWNGYNAQNRLAGSGTYFYRVQYSDRAGNRFVQTRKMIFMK